MPENIAQMKTDSVPVYEAVMKWLSGLWGSQHYAANQPLLTTEEINRLIATAGKSNKSQQLSSNQAGRSGEQASGLTGSGMDFADRRPYAFGDDPRYIDWKASARSQQTLFKKYFTEVNTASCIVIDRSSSMAFGTRKRLKITQAIRVGVTLGTRILRGGQSLACLILDETEYWQPAQNSLDAFRKTIDVSARGYSLQSQQESVFNWRKMSDHLQNHLPSGSRVFIISDFFSLDQEGQVVLQQLNNRYDLSAVQIIDQSEVSLPPVHNISLHFRQKSKLDLNTPKVSKQFDRSLQQKIQQQADWFKTNGIHFFRLKSHDDLKQLRAEF